MSTADPDNPPRRENSTSLRYHMCYLGPVLSARISLGLEESPVSHSMASWPATFDIRPVMSLVHLEVLGGLSAVWCLSWPLVMAEGGLKTALPEGSEVLLHDSRLTLESCLTLNKWVLNLPGTPCCQTCQHTRLDI